MVKVSNVKTSSQTQSHDRNPEFKTTDELGRTYILKRPTYLKGLQFIKALGELAENTTYYNAVYFFNWIKNIDGFEPPLGTPLEIEALAQRLDHEGVIAVREKVLEWCNALGKTQEELEQQAEQESKATQAFAKK